jgi:CRP-like cAMP-binding protein
MITEQLNDLEKLGCFYIINRDCLKSIKKEINENTSLDKRINEYQRVKTVNEMPKKIQILIVSNMFKEAYRKIRFFSNKDWNFLIDVMPRLSYLDVSPQTIIYNRNDDPDFVYFMLSGRVAYTLGPNNFQFKSIVAGAYFGEIEILKDTQRFYTVISEDHCEFLLMRANLLDEIMKKYPIFCNEIWTLSEKRYYKNKECYMQVVDLIEEVEIRKEATFRRLAGTKKKKEKNHGRDMILMNANEFDDRIFQSFDELTERIEKIMKVVSSGID